MEKGTLYWISGLSGAGKSTVGTLLYQYLRARKDNVVLIDGDALRAVMDDYDFTEEGRERTMKRNARLFRMLTEQGIDVVNCAIGLRDEYRDCILTQVENCREIYLKVSLDELIRRDPKGLYRRALSGEAKHVYGVDLPYDAPKHPAAVVENEGGVTPEEALAQIVRTLGL